VGSLTQLTDLTNLNLGQCYGVTDKGVRELARLTALTSLNLDGCRGVTEEGLRVLAFRVSRDCPWRSARDEIGMNWL
jgi:hypothetical protein